MGNNLVSQHISDVHALQLCKKPASHNPVNKYSRRQYAAHPNGSAKDILLV